MLHPETTCWDDFFAGQPLPADERIPDIEELEYEKREFFN